MHIINASRDAPYEEHRGSGNFMSNGKSIDQHPNLRLLKRHVASPISSDLPVLVRTPKNGTGNAGFGELRVEIVSFSGCLLIKDDVTVVI